jgi:hypothetical protein
MEPDICARKHGHNANSFLANLRVAEHKPTLCQRIYLALEKWGPLTCEELSFRLQIRYTTVSARIAELKAMRWITPSGIVRPTTSGTYASAMRHLKAEEREALLNPKRGYSGKQAELFA